MYSTMQKKKNKKMSNGDYLFLHVGKDKYIAASLDEVFFIKKKTKKIPY